LGDNVAEKLDKRMYYRLCRPEAGNQHIMLLPRRIDLVRVLRQKRLGLLVTPADGVVERVNQVHILGLDRGQAVLALHASVLLLVPQQP
jgi:hypothetical protein